jgi:hypothetical protein
MDMCRAVGHCMFACRHPTAGTMSDYIPVADADGFDANVSHIKPRPHGALLPAIGNYERFSLRYRMKVK